MLGLDRFDLEDIATALQDQDRGGFGHQWLVDPRTGEIVLETEDNDLGLQETEDNDLDEVAGNPELILIEPLPSHVWYQDMADFAQGISDERAGRRLARAIDGRGAFRRFRDELYEEYPHLLAAWHAQHDARSKRRAVEWLVDNQLVNDEEAIRFLAEHPDPQLP